MTKNQANHLKNLRALNVSRRPKPSRPIVRMAMTIIVPMSANRKITMVVSPLFFIKVALPSCFMCALTQSVHENLRYARNDNRINFTLVDCHQMMGEVWHPQGVPDLSPGQDATFRSSK